MLRWTIHISAFFLLMIIGLYCPDVSAYILETPHILHLMVENMGPAENLRISQNLFLYNKGPENALELKQTVWYRGSDKYRSDTEFEKSRRIHVYNSKQALIVLDGAITSVNETETDHYKDILLFRNREELTTGLITLGVNVTITSLGICDDQIGYVIGAVYPDSTRAQLWVNQKTFRPFRLLLPAHNAVQDGMFDIRYLHWRQSGRTWYPREIKIYQYHQLIQLIAVENIQTEDEMDETLFDIDQLRRKYSAVTPAAENAPADPLGEVEQSIQEFKSMYDE